MRCSEAECVTLFGTLVGTQASLNRTKSFSSRQQLRPQGTTWWTVPAMITKSPDVCPNFPTYHVKN